jgi:GxxExxY protein
MNHEGTKAQSNTKEEPVTARENWIAQQVVNIAFDIHNKLGPGLLESVYEKCFCSALELRGINYQRQKMVELVYNNVVIDDGLRIDILVEDLVIIELKAQENYHPIWEAQLLSYLKLTNKKLGLLINFHVPLIKNGIKRMVN